MADEHHDHDHHDHHDHDHEHEHTPDYASAVAAFRADKDEAFRSAIGSPIRPEDVDAFTGIPYYPVDPAMVFEGLRLEPYAGSEPARFAIPTSDDKLRPAHRAGTFTFEHDGEPRRLTAYTLGDDDGHSHSLFLPFLDATSGRETYGAGRYLDLEPDEDGTYAIDFNLAYHPLCVYNEKYSCPLTPAENRLPFAVEAGERLAEGH